MKVRAKIQLSGIEQDVRYWCREMFPKEQLACVHGARYVRQLAKEKGISLEGTRRRRKKKRR